MNYYPHHIGDYVLATAHLSLLEDAIYMRLLRRYYSDEMPLINNLNLLCRIVGAKSDDERDAVGTILTEFFYQTEDGLWHNKRADEEILKYQKNLEVASRAGKNSAQRRFNDRSTTVELPLNDSSTIVQLTKNQEPRTINQEPNKTLLRTDVRDDGFKKLFETFWQAYPKKKSKGDAEKAFRALKPRPCEQLVATMIATIERAKTTEQWAKEGGQFIPYPATWLRAKGWLDEAIAPVKSAGDLWLEQKLAEKKSAQSGGVA